MFTSILHSFLLLVSITSVTSTIDRQTFGYGLSRRSTGNSLKSLKGEGNATSCPNVEEYYFKHAVVDNFASAQDIQYWAGNGQRYWLNKEFWSGPGAPIFVFIG